MKKNKIYYKKEESTEIEKILKMSEVRDKTLIIGSMEDTIATKEYINIITHPFKIDIENTIDSNNKIKFNVPTSKNMPLLNNYEFKGDIYSIVNDIMSIYKIENTNVPQFYIFCNERLLSNSIKVLSEMKIPITLENLIKIMFNDNESGRTIVRQFSRITDLSEIYNWFLNEYYAENCINNTFESSYGIRALIKHLFDNGLNLNSYTMLFFKNLRAVLSELKYETTVLIEDLDKYEYISKGIYGNLFKTTYYINNKNINYISFTKNLLFLNNFDENLKELILNEHELIDLKPIDLYSGEIKIRVPKILHQELSRKASLENTSLNQYLLYLIAKYS